MHTNSKSILVLKIYTYHKKKFGKKEKIEGRPKTRGKIEEKI